MTILHTENPGIGQFIQAFSGILRDIRLAIFSHFEEYLGTLRHTEAYSGIIEVNGAIIRHICNSM